MGKVAGRPITRLRRDEEAKGVPLDGFLKDGLLERGGGPGQLFLTSSLESPIPNLMALKRAGAARKKFQQRKDTQR